MKTEKTYIVISRYAMKNNNIGMVLAKTIGEAMKEAETEISTPYTLSVEIYEADKAEYCFFGKQIFKYSK